ncbi:MAG TPA: hypothetical protein VFA26_14620 [Gemmataceae bacterium]|nr:hypothetical protein [Gemmataceae bacterium]
MYVIKLERRYLNLSHVASVCVGDGGVEVVTPYEVVRLAGRDADSVVRAMERLARQTEREWTQAGTSA